MNAAYVVVYDMLYNETMRLTYKYRLFPTSAQRTALNRALDACRWVYNQTLEVRREAWRDGQRSLSLYDTNKLLTQWKRERPELHNAFSQCLQEAQRRVDLAFQAFFRRVQAGEEPGYPRFKGMGWYKSFTYKQAGKGFKLDGDRLYLSKIGAVRIKLHRPLEDEVKTLTIRRDVLGNWYACFSIEVEPEPLPPSPQVVGIDLGLIHFATLSTGEQIANPRFFRQDERALAKAQRRLSECEKGTAEYRKRRRVVQHIHQRIANRRNDFAHQLSRRLADTFQLVVFEGLDIRDMQKNGYRSLRKSISDAAWNQLVQYTRYKAEKAGRACVRVDPRGTTQECFACGEVVPKDLSVRMHQCPHCGCVLDRDLNASLNVLARGLASVGFDP
jgi:putative transposase